MTLPAFRPAVVVAAVLGLCVALGPSTAGFFLYRGLVKTKASDRYITVKGLVEKVVRSDRGTFEVSFKISGNDLTQLYQKLSDDTERVQHFFLQEGFIANEITQNAPRLSDLHMREFGNGGPLAPERYLIEHTIFVNSSQVDKLSTLASKIGELLRQGIAISQNNTKYYLDQFNTLRPQLIASAMKNATEMAESFAHTTGSQIGGIRQANQGVIQIADPNTPATQEWSDATSSLMKQLRVVATVQFYIQ